jgi:hypothetical protein
MQNAHDLERRVLHAEENYVHSLYRKQAAGKEVWAGSVGREIGEDSLNFSHMRSRQAVSCTEPQRSKV